MGCPWRGWEQWLLWEGFPGRGVPVLGGHGDSSVCPWQAGSAPCCPPGHCARGAVPGTGGAVPGTPQAQVRVHQARVGLSRAQVKVPQARVGVSCRGSLPREGRKCVCALSAWLEVALGVSHMPMALPGGSQTWLHHGAALATAVPRGRGTGGCCGVWRMEVLPAAHALRVEDN